MTIPPIGSKCAKMLAARVAASVALVIVVGVGTPMLSQVMSEHYLKGVFLYNFVRLTDWADMNDNTAATLDICVLGASDVVDDLRSAAAGKLVGDQRVAVRRVRDVRSVNGCRVLFVDGDGMLNDKDLKTVQWGIMTVGEADDFLKRGGMIRFVNVGGRLSFEVNAALAQQQGVKLSSRLLSVARKVHQ